MERGRFRLIDEAFAAGDLTALRAAVGDPPGFPDNPMPPGIGRCLTYAIYHSPLRFIDALLVLGADPNLDDGDGFPPLIAALTKTRVHDGSPARGDVIAVLERLLDAGADPNQRGLNDWTALHMAVAQAHPPAVALLLRRGADVTLRTRIDDCETPLEMARARLGADPADRADLTAIVGMLEAALPRS